MLDQADSNFTPGTKKIFKPEKNQIQISSRKPARHYIFLSKIFLTYFPTIELHALGEATKIAVRVAENLDRYGYTKLKTINSFTFVPEAQKGQSQERRGKKVKMIIGLDRAQGFENKATGIKKDN